jgi:hypothetical protein
MADQAKSQRQEGLAALTLGQKIYSDEATLQASLARAAKEGDMNSYARTYAVAARERGDSRSDTQLLQEGAQEYVKLRGGLEARLMQAGAAQTGAAAATSQAVTAGERVRTDAEIRRDEAQIRRDEAQRKREDENDKNRRDAVKNVNARISEPSIDLRRRIRKDGEAKVRAELMQEELGVYGLGAPKPTSPPPGFQAKGQLPPGFQLVR